uniref:Frizzled9/10 protein n=1 Tax=Terebratalia transversa TaxID=34513 RepID=A0AAU7ECB1_TERTR
MWQQFINMLKPATWLFIMLMVERVRVYASVLDHERDKGKCVPIEIPFCKNMKYNFTSMPNLVGNDDQNAASQEVNQFTPLVQVGCSSMLSFFLCSMYAPMCTEQVEETLIIPICQSMCLKVREQCEPILKRLKFNWPAKLNCDHLPSKTDPPGNNLCMEAPNVNDKGSGNSNPPSVVLPKGIKIPDFGNISPDLRSRYHQILNNKQKTNAVIPKSTRPPYVIPNVAIPDSRLRYIGSTCGERFIHYDKNKNNSCAPRCDIDVFYSKQDKKFAEIWIIVWASLCCFSTIITTLTFIIDTKRFKYPERPIIFLSFCYALYSIGYLLRVAAGSHTVVCDRTSDGKEFVIQEGLENTWCIVVFLFLYYFGMASSVWWLVLTVTWFLSAAHKWGSEAIANLGTYFHLAAWGLPAIKTIVILTLRDVDGDPLTGLCYVGNQDSRALTGFVIAPLMAYLVTGTVFLLAGFIALLRIKERLKLEGTNIRKLEKLMAKIGIFSILYTLPATCVIGCLFYEQINMKTWKNRAKKNPCKDGKCTLEHSIPTVEVFMLKVFMSLVVGITSGMWIWSKKTIQSWTQFCNRTFKPRKSNIPTYSYYAAQPSHSPTHNSAVPAAPANTEVTVDGNVTKHAMVTYAPPNGSHKVSMKPYVSTNKQQWENARV